MCLIRRKIIKEADILCKKAENADVTFSQQVGEKEEEKRGVEDDVEPEKETPSPQTCGVPRKMHTALL